MLTVGITVSHIPTISNILEFVLPSVKYIHKKRILTGITSRCFFNTNYKNKVNKIKFIFKVDFNSV